MLHQPRAQAKQASYLHQANDLFWAHVEIVGIHQFLQLAGNQDVIDTAIQLVSPIDNTVNISEMVGTLPETVFAMLSDATTPLTGGKLRALLKSAGLADEITEAVSKTFEELIAITAFARFKHADQPELQRAFTVVQGKNDHWLLSLTAPNVLQIRSMNENMLLQLLHNFGQTD